MPAHACILFTVKGRAPPSKLGEFPGTQAANEDPLPTYMNRAPETQSRQVHSETDSGPAPADTHKTNGKPMNARDRGVRPSDPQ